MENEVEHDPGSEQIGVQREGWHYTIVENSIIDDERLSIYANMTGVVLCRYASLEEKTCYPSINTISKKAGCSRTKVFEGLIELEKYGHIKRQSRKGTSNVYTLLDGVVRETDGGSPPGGRGVVRETDTNERHFGRDSVDERTDVPVENKNVKNQPEIDRLFDSFHITNIDRENHVRTYGTDKVLAQLRYMSKQKQIDDPGAYLNSALFNDYTGKNKLNQEAIKREQEAEDRKRRENREAKEFAAKCEAEGVNPFAAIREAVGAAG